MKSIVAIALLALSLAAAAKVSPAARASEPPADLTKWANATLGIPYGDAHPVSTAVGDSFGSSATPIAKQGKYIPTAGKGSAWEYDPAHHIAAVYEFGDVNGLLVFYAPPPPQPLPARDLSHISSGRGLHLGLSAERASTLLGVPSSAVRHISPGKTMLYARKLWRCSAGKYPCSHDAQLHFVDDRAVAITLVDVGP